MKIHNITIMTALFSICSVLMVSCGGVGDKENPSDKLRAYCVRQCVLETGDSSLCDTKCECASKELSDKLSTEDFNSLVTSITANDPDASQDALKEFGKAFSHCKSVRK